MKATICFCLLWALGLGGARAAENNAVAFRVQLIRGTDEVKAREASWKPAGEDLSKRLGSGFRWKNYWEVTQLTMTVVPGKSARTRLSADREVEIRLLDSGESEARYYSKGELVRKCRQAAHDKLCIMGGTRENDESWFVVLKREKPGPDDGRSGK
jgi:hypothetical protein